MKITECKRYTILPKKGTLVTTRMKKNIDLPDWKNSIYLVKRRNADGVYLDFVAGSSGDWWWIQHEGDVAVYASSEVFDR